MPVFTVRPCSHSSTVRLASQLQPLEIAPFLRKLRVIAPLALARTFAASSLLSRLN